MVRGVLMQHWRERANAGADQRLRRISQTPEIASQYKTQRGQGGFVRASWDEVNEIIAAANAYHHQNYGPDRVIGFRRFRRCRWCLTPLAAVT